jgi:uncharacterized protein (TIGR00255 family)
MTVEVKTVNHRFLDVNLRVPRGLFFLENPIRKAISAHLIRGHADVFVTYRNARDDAREVAVNIPLALAYADALNRLAIASGMVDDRSLSRLAEMPDVLTVAEKTEDQDAVVSLCMHALTHALGQVAAMRALEGESMARDIAARLDALAHCVAGIGERAPGVVAEYRASLEARLKVSLASPPDPWRLAQEIAILAERAAIDEELVRLDSHIAQFRAALETDEPVGRKLDFIVQELHREINTTGSKASDLVVSSLVVSAKAEIEKIREQVQNIE